METNHSPSKFARAFVAAGLLGLAAIGCSAKPANHASASHPEGPPQIGGGYTERVLDYRHGTWYRLGVAISEPGQCPAEDSCQPAYVHGRWVAAKLPADVECDDYEVAGQVECIHGNTGAPWQPGS